MLQRVPDALMAASADELANLDLHVLDSSAGPGVPEDLAGRVFIVGPVGSVDSRGPPRQDGIPLFDGNAMISRLDFDGAAPVRVSSKVARTPCYYADAASRPGRRFERLGFHDHGLLRFSLHLGLRNQLNMATGSTTRPGGCRRGSRTSTGTAAGYGTSCRRRSSTRPTETIPTGRSGSIGSGHGRAPPR
jgi:Retinal pigment epithelial membrane protein